MLRRWPVRFQKAPRVLSLRKLPAIAGGIKACVAVDTAIARDIALAGSLNTIALARDIGGRRWIATSAAAAAEMISPALRPSVRPASNLRADHARTAPVRGCSASVWLPFADIGGHYRNC